MTTPYRGFLAAIELIDGRAEVSFRDDWSQGRSVFGGLVTAAGLRAMRSLVAPERQPRSIMVSFVSPVATEDATIETRVLRHGKSITQTEARVVQNGQDCAVVLAVFGADRQSSIAVSPALSPRVKDPTDSPPLPIIPGLIPNFIQHFDIRWAIGQRPYSGADSSEIGGWCRLVDPDTTADGDRDREADEEAILMLVDAWPPAVLPMLSGFAPGSSVTWSIDFVAPLPRESTRDWWFYQARALAAHGGYAQTEATLWAPSGHTAAVSRQLVAVFG